MRARIHRGAVEVGGSVVEVEHDGQRIVLDLGLPLNSPLGEVAQLPNIEGLRNGGDGLLGVVLTHAHPDHYGLLPQVSEAVPVFCGSATARILSEAAFFSPGGMELVPAGLLIDRKQLRIGPFQITPMLVDHSAYDAFALLVEAGGRALLYTGDLRGHGRKSALFETLIAKPASGIDVLLMEGTRIDELDARVRGLASEAAVEAEIFKSIQEASGLVLIMFSPQNIDRLVSIYRATRQAGRTLVLDLYGVSIAAATQNSRIPQASWDNVRVYVPHAQRVRVKRSGQFARVEQVARSRIYREDLAANPDRYVLLFRESMSREFADFDRFGGAVAVWSMWAGYLVESSGLRIRDFLKTRDIPLVIHHASGHASRADLLRLADAVNAGRVIPIHTAAPEAFIGLVGNAEIKGDGEWWAV